MADNNDRTSADPFGVTGGFGGTNLQQLFSSLLAPPRSVPAVELKCQGSACVMRLRITLTTDFLTKLFSGDVSRVRCPSCKHIHHFQLRVQVSGPASS